MAAQSNLGWCYDAGCGVAPDETQAVRWYRKAALQNDDTALYNLGVHYEWGSGVAEDKVEAVTWYHRAAEQGYEKASAAWKRLTAELAEGERRAAETAAEAELTFRTACRDALADGARKMPAPWPNISRAARNCANFQHLTSRGRDSFCSPR